MITKEKINQLAREYYLCSQNKVESHKILEGIKIAARSLGIWYEFKEVCKEQDIYL